MITTDEAAQFLRPVQGGGRGTVRYRPLMDLGGAVIDVNDERRESVFDHRLFKIIALVADMSAVVAVAAGLTGALIVFGLVAVSLGTIQLWGRRHKPLDRWSTFAIVTVVAGVMALTVVVDRAVIGNSLSNAVASGQGEPQGHPSRSAPPTPTDASSPISTSATTTKESASTGPGVSLVNMAAIEDGELPSAHLKLGELKVNGTKYDRVKSGSPHNCGDDRPVSDSYQIDRNYRTLKAQVGLSDDTPSGRTVKFNVIVDGSIKYVETVSVGQMKPVVVDIRGALRVELKAEHVGRTVCDGLTVVAWIDPTVT